MGATDAFLRLLPFSKQLETVLVSYILLPNVTWENDQVHYN